VNRKIDIISNASEDQNSQLAEKTINEIIERKNTPSGKIKAIVLPKGFKNGSTIFKTF